jgi:hypothetical protein
MTLPDDTVLSILATPGLDWEPLRQWLAPMLPDVLAVEWPTWEALSSGKLPAGARCLVFVGSASAALARRIPDAENAELDRLLAAWKDAADRCLRLVQAQRDQVLLIDTAEVQANPQGLAQRCSSLTGWPFSSPGAVPGPAAIEPIAQTLATCLMSTDVGLCRLQAELEAACTPLNEGDPPESAPQRFSRSAILSAIDAYRGTRVRESALAQPIEPLDQKHSALESENDMLLLQLHQVQEELEHYYLENRALRAGSDRRVADLATQLAEPDFGRAIEHGPHRHLNLTLELPPQGDRAGTELALRLVDHQGVPGLLIFAPNGAAPLRAWSASGQEGGRAFMLIHPAQHGMRSWFERLGSHDWQCLEAIVSRIESALAARQCSASGAEAERLGRWLIVAHRVARQLEALPRTLRHDGVQVERSAEGGDGGLDVVLTNVDYATLRLPSLRLRWSTATAAPRLELLVDPEPTLVPPLSIWGVDADGRWQTSCTLRFGAALDKREARRQWAALGSSDHDFVAALLHALQQWATNAADVPDNRTIAAQAARMLAEARVARWKIEHPGRRSVSLLGLEISA